jgi:hypothetical protein
MARPLYFCLSFPARSSSAAWVYVDPAKDASEFNVRVLDLSGGAESLPAVCREFAGALAPWYATDAANVTLVSLLGEDVSNVSVLVEGCESEGLAWLAAKLRPPQAVDVLVRAWRRSAVARRRAAL